MKHADFVHLHVHTQYSLLDGTIRLHDLLARARQFRMPAIAMTDHGNMFGAVDFYQQAFKAGIKPIIGCELYVAPGSRHVKSGGMAGEGGNHHLVVLVRNMQGYRNLMKLTSAAYLEGFYYKPRVDKDLLAGHSEGLIGLSACLHGEVADCLLRGDEEAAAAAAEGYRHLFGEGQFYLELMENGIPEQTRVNAGLRALARRLDLPVVATCDCHYLNREDAEAHEVLLCIQTGKTLEDRDRMRFATDQFYVRSPEEMQALFADCPEAIDNTIKIAEQCNLSLEFGSFYLPRFEVSAEETLDERLRAEAHRGLAARMPSILQGRSDPAVAAAYEKRLREELAMIQSMGFAGYFLIVADFVNYAKSRGIPVGPGRGSAAGSLVAYAIGITNIDPIHYGLFFERFLNPDRKSMPDIDIDFCPEGRSEIIQYVTEKYGKDRVAQIISFGKMQARAVIRDVGRAMKIPYGEVDAIAKLVPGVLNITLDQALEMEPRLREAQKKSDQIAKLLAYSRTLEGLNRHSSTHPAGVVISDVPLLERVPLCAPKDDVVTQFAMQDIQAVGLTKFDFLGLKTLTVIKDVCRFVREGRGEAVDVDRLPLDDPLTYELLSRGDTDGIFQLESSGMRENLVRMKPNSIEDLIALIALYRPGPMNMIPEFVSRKQGKTSIVYELPELEPILQETYGVILYQEQVMQIASLVGGYTMAEADTLRKIMSKKIAAEMEKEEPKFLAGAKKKHIPEQKARTIWDQMKTFAEYGFNKSHSAAYGIVAFQTAYLKAHYPAEFMAALLTSEKDNRDKIIRHISGCKDMGIGVLPPDINASQRDFTVAGMDIRFGLAAVKNVGVGAIEAVIAAREQDGPFRSFEDFLRRVDLRKANKRVVESLIKCGAFDSLGKSRRHLMASYETLMDGLQRRQRSRSTEQASFFDQMGAGEGPGAGPEAPAGAPDLPEWDHRELLAYEKETLGFYITGHPLLRYADRLAVLCTGNSANLSEKRDKEPVTFGGIVSAIKEVTTKRKEIMAYVTLEDLQGSVDVLFFADVYRKAHACLHADEPLLVRGVMDVGEENIRIVAHEVQLLVEAAAQPVNAVHFTVDASRATAEDILALREVFSRHRGECDGFLHLVHNGTETVIYLGEDCRLDVSRDLKREADLLLGAGATRILSS